MEKPKTLQEMSVLQLYEHQRILENSQSLTPESEAILLA